MQKKFYSREEEFIYYLKKRNSINWTKIQCKLQSNAILILIVFH